MIGGNESIPDVKEKEPMFIDTSKGVARTVLESLVVTVVLVTCIILFLLIMFKKKLRGQMHLLLVANLAAAGLIFGLLVRPGTIHEEIRSYELGAVYCSFYLFLLKVEWIVVPYTLWMLGIERCIAVNEPQNHAAKFTPLRKAIMLLFPWIFGVVTTLVVNVALVDEILTRYASYRYDPYFDEYAHFQQVGCMALYAGGLFMVAHLIWIVIGTVIPFLGLIITSITLFSLYWKKCRGKRGDPEERGSSPVAVVHVGSIIYSIILSTTFAFVLTEEFVLLESGSLSTFLYTHWFVCIGELMMAALGLSVLAEIRGALAAVCGCGGETDEERALLDVSRQVTQTSGEK